MNCWILSLSIMLSYRNIYVHMSVDKKNSRGTPVLVTEYLSDMQTLGKFQGTRWLPWIIASGVQDLFYKCNSVQGYMEALKMLCLYAIK